MTRVTTHRLWRFGRLSPEDADLIAAWTYPEPYALYDIAPGLRQATAAAMLDPANAYEAAHSGPRGLVAFWCAGGDARVLGGTYHDTAVDLGCGLRPDLTGQGLGRSLVGAVLARASARFPHGAFCVTIAAFNTRARRVWRAHGFSRDHTFFRAADAVEFIVLRRSSNLS